MKTEYTLLIALIIFTSGLAIFYANQPLPYIITCSHSTTYADKGNTVWSFQIPDKKGDCPEHATHWKLYGERIKN